MLVRDRHSIIVNPSLLFSFAPENRMYSTETRPDRLHQDWDELLDSVISRAVSMEQ